MIGNFWKYLDLPNVLVKNGSQWPRNEDFQNIKMLLSDVHPIYSTFLPVKFLDQAVGSFLYVTFLF